MFITSKELTLEEVRYKFEARKSQIMREYEDKIRKLEEKIGQHKKQRDTRLTRSEKRFRKEFCLTLKEIVGKEDYELLSKWLVTRKKKEVGEAEKRYEKERACELKDMSSEDYLLYYLNDPEIEKRLQEDKASSKPKDFELLTSVVTKLKLEHAWLDGTLL